MKRYIVAREYARNKTMMRLIKFFLRYPDKKFSTMALLSRFGFRHTYFQTLNNYLNLLYKDGFLRKNKAKKGQRVFYFRSSNPYATDD